MNFFKSKQSKQPVLESSWDTPDKPGFSKFEKEPELNYEQYDTKSDIVSGVNPMMKKPKKPIGGKKRTVMKNKKLKLKKTRKNTKTQKKTRKN